MKELIIIFLFILSINLVNGIDTDGLQGYWSFDTNADDDYRGVYNGTVTGATNTGVGCQSNNCYDFDGTADYITFTDPVIGIGNKTICAYIQHDNDVDFDVIITNTVGTGSSDSGFTMATYESGGKLFQMKAGNGVGANEYMQHLGSVDDYNLNYYCYDMVSYLSDTNLTMYEDGVIDGSDTSVTGTETSPSENLRLGSSSLATFEFEGIIDELTIWNRTLTTAEIQELDSLDGNPGMGGGGGGGTTPALSFTVNITNATVYSFGNNPTGIVQYNLTSTITNNSNIYNGNLYFNDTFMSNYSNVDLSSSVYLNFSFIDLEMIWEDVYINFSNANASYQVALNLTMDGINPVITTGYVNGSSYNVTTNNNTDTVNFNFTFSDTNLDGFIYEIRNDDINTQIAYIFIENLTVSTYTLEEIIDFANLTTGMTEDTTDTFSINITVGDSHNPLGKQKPVRELDYYYTNDTITIENEITLRADNLKLGVNNKGKEFTYFFLEDNKYKFKTTFENQDTTHTFYISKSGLRYIDYRGYKGHFVHSGLKRYVDFEGNNIESVEVSNYFDEYKVRVNLIEASDEIEFESIGDLNTVNEIRYFDITLSSVESLNTALLSSIDSHLNNLERYVKMIGLNIIPLIFGFFCLLGALSLGAVHDVLRISLFILSFVSVLSSYYLSSIVLNGTDAQITNVIADQTYLIGWIIGIIVFYFLIYSIYVMFRKAAQEKNERLQY